MKTMEWSEYLNTQQDSYLDSENGADCEVVYELNGCTIRAHKSLHAGENDYYFGGSDEDFAIVTDKDGHEQLYYDCTLSEIINEITAEKNNGTMRQKAIDYVNDMTANELDRLIICGHDTNSHKWIEVETDGEVHETEEANNNTRHYVSYPDKEVKNIYNINDQSAGACCCDICAMYSHFEDWDKEEFIERYSEDDWNYCNKTDKDDAILQYHRDNDCPTREDIRKQMIDAIEDIEYGYFDDED